MSTGVIDTSVFIAQESGRGLQAVRLPDEGYVTVITLAELEAGVLSAQDADARAARLLTYQALADVDLLTVDPGAAHEWARLRYKLALAGRRVNVNDLWIAAIASARGLPVYTQDDDFDAISAEGGPEVIHV
ncbi:MAG: PIN domain-containing protein [Propionibacteriaceae bacterium]|jgi:predicted nucleic acid-binding protein|nr:PIN domain-containing protein [Propionibacteriaceae bacterium]